MNKVLKKLICITLSILVFSMLLVGCSNQNTQTSESPEGENEEVPEIIFSWGNSLHTAMPEVAIKKVDEFKEKGVYFNPLSKDKYELIEDGKKLAVISYVPNKGASEVATLMGQGHIDAALCSNTGILSAIDKGTDVKILCPVQTGAIALVFPPDTDFYGWEDLKKYILDSKAPVKIGYHSPVSGPRLVLESVCIAEGLKVTEDPSDADADVLLVDLKGTSNLIPSLTGKQVDAWVGPAHFPETAESKGLGKIVLHLEDFPPEGKWANFPCCVFSVREEVLNKYPEVFKALTKILDECCEYCMEHRDEASDIMADFIGIEGDIIKTSKIVYTTDPTEEWIDGIKIYVDALNKMNKFDGRLKEMPFDELVNKCFDFSYIKEIKK